MVAIDINLGGLRKPACAVEDCLHVFLKVSVKTGEVTW